MTTDISRLIGSLRAFPTHGEHAVHGVKVHKPETGIYRDDNNKSFALDHCHLSHRSGIDALASLVLPGWVGGMVTGAVFTGAGLFFIYLRWKEDRK